MRAQPLRADARVPGARVCPAVPVPVGLPCGHTRACCAQQPAVPWPPQPLPERQLSALAPRRAASAEHARWLATQSRALRQVLLRVSRPKGGVPAVAGRLAAAAASMGRIREVLRALTRGLNPHRRTRARPQNDPKPQAHEQTSATRPAVSSLRLFSSRSPTADFAAAHGVGPRSVARRLSLCQPQASAF